MVALIRTVSGADSTRWPFLFPSGIAFAGSGSSAIERLARFSPLSRLLPPHSALVRFPFRYSSALYNLDSLLLSSSLYPFLPSTVLVRHPRHSKLCFRSDSECLRHKVVPDGFLSYRANPLPQSSIPSGPPLVSAFPIFSPASYFPLPSSFILFATPHIHRQSTPTRSSPPSPLSHR